jgi:hypothetical protein
MTPPATLIAISVQNNLPLTVIPRRYTIAEAIPPGTVIIEEVAFATTGSIPANTSAGNSMKVPPPARALTTPAAVAAAKRMIQEKREISRTSSC